MLKEERLDKIVNLANENEIVLTEALIEQVGVSPATIRRDINELVEQGRIEKVRGGVMSKYRRSSLEPSYSAKGRMNYEEKRRISQRASELVESGGSIMLDSGSTCLELAKMLYGRSNLSIVTNDLLIAMEFAANQNNNSVIFAGGLLRRDYYASYGSFCEDMLRQIHVQRAFMGVDAVDIKRGIMSYTPDDIRVKQIMMEISDEIILLCDHTKFDAAAYIRIGPLTGVSRIITGRELSDENYKSLCELGVPVERV